ncbi:MAG: hypothetical protein ACPLKQ_00830 [Candidatus Bathyarchaeales archaeon]
MAGSTIDHLIAMTVFIGALLIFISLFNQTIQTAVLYQRNRAVATKCSDLLDNMLLNPGIPANWSRMERLQLEGFGLQDPEFTQYRLSPFSLMRLRSFTGEPVYYRGTNMYYSNITMGFGEYLLVSFSQVLNYSTVAKLLGINNTYGFQLSISPIVMVSIRETRAGNPLTLAVSVTGKGFPLSDSVVSYCLLTVVEKGGQSSPAYRSKFGIAYTDNTGTAVLKFEDVGAGTSYALIVYAHLSGLVGVGYHQRVSADKRYVIPFIESIEDRRVILAHSYDVHYFGPPESAVFFNATFVLLSEDFTLREMPMENSTGKIGKVNYGKGEKFEYANITIPTYNPGILVVTYQSNNEYGVILMPWGVSAMAFPVVFGENPSGKEWVATDIRQVMVGNVAYQAKLALWRLEGYGVIG